MYQKRRRNCPMTTKPEGADKALSCVSRIMQHRSQIARTVRVVSTTAEEQVKALSDHIRKCEKQILSLRERGRIDRAKIVEAKRENSAARLQLLLVSSYA